MYGSCKGERGVLLDLGVALQCLAMEISRVNNKLAFYMISNSVIGGGCNVNETSRIYNLITEWYMVHCATVSIMQLAWVVFSSATSVKNSLYTSHWHSSGTGVTY